MTKSLIIKPPQNVNDVIEFSFQNRLFLAGSIEQGTATNWQKLVEKELEHSNLVIFNPRRDDWDSSWKMDVNNPQFYGQVIWELTAMENSQVIAMYFAAGTNSPISLLELGLHARSGNKLVVFCPQDFYRKGNVDVTCRYYGIPVHDNYETWMLDIKRKLRLI